MQPNGPGSFSGRESSPRPQRGPDPRSRTSLAIFISATAVVLRAPLTSTIVSWAASASNLLGAVTNGRPVSLAILEDAARKEEVISKTSKPAERKRQRGGGDA